MSSKRTISHICEQCGDSYLAYSAPSQNQRFCSRRCGNRGKYRHAGSSPDEREHSFWVKVDKTDGCWLWTAGRVRNGYGWFWHRQAHRISWEMHNGPIPDALWVLHRCDNPPCVRPDHLFLGTPGDNTRDSAIKGRHRNFVWPTGELHPNARLADAAVREIRERYAAGGVTQIVLATRYGVSRSQIGRIIQGKQRPVGEMVA